MLDLILNNKVFHIILVSIFSGAIIGIEREYKNKITGFRTIILICLSASIFTHVSQINDSDRIAANIVTGIGFLGAGVIFQGRFEVAGITTATVIWTTSAIGMVIGFGELTLGFTLALISVVILSLFEYVESIISKFFSRNTILITFIDSDKEHLNAFNEFLSLRKVKYYCKKIIKDENKISVIYEIAGHKQVIDQIDKDAVNLRYIFTYNNS